MILKKDMETEKELEKETEREREDTILTRLLHV